MAINDPRIAHDIWEANLQLQELSERPLTNQHALADEMQRIVKLVER